MKSRSSHVVADTEGKARPESGELQRQRCHRARSMVMSIGQKLDIIIVGVDWHEVTERDASGIKVKSWGRR